jgi:hypothetical protein
MCAFGTVAKRLTGVIFQSTYTTSFFINGSETKIPRTGRQKPEARSRRTVVVKCLPVGLVMKVQILVVVEMLRAARVKIDGLASFPNIIEWNFLIDQRNKKRSDTKIKHFCRN